MNRNRWKATAVVDLRSDDGSALSDATVTVRVRTYVIDKKGNGEWEESTIEVSTDDEGRAEIDSGNLKRNGNNRVTEVELVIDDVQAADDSEWDGNDTSTSVTAP